MTSSKVTLIVASLVLSAFIGIGSVGKVHADTNAWATPFPDYCHGITGCLNTGTNPWLGGADTGGDRATTGVRVKIIVSSDTNPANIPSDNSLGAGIAAAVLCAGSSDCGAGCPDALHGNCPLTSEDYIFYGFVDLSHSGRVRFISSGWHDCEFDNCAPVVSNLPKDCLTGENGWNTCPDSYHWQLFHESWTCTDCSVAGSNFLVEMMWVGGTAVWNYYRSTSTCSLCLIHSFSYTPLSSFHMESNYKTGSGQTCIPVIACFPVWYHYQFGVTALKSIGAGWNIEMDDPEYYSTDCNSVASWCLVRNAAVYDGYNSYFDDNYDLGGQVFSGGTPVNEPNFNGVTVSSLQVDSKCYTAVGFSYTGNTPAQTNGQSLWTNAGPGCSFPGDVTVMTTSSPVPADGTSTSTIMAQLANMAPNIQISFSSTLGQLSSSTCTTDSSGYCYVTIKSSTVGTATITATTCSIGNCPNAQATVSFSSPTPPTFTLSVSPTSQAIPVGSEKQTVVTVTSVGGFSGTVTLTIPSSPGVACWFTSLTSTATVYVPAGGSAKEYPTCTSGGPTGSHIVYIQGTSGTLVNCVILPVTVMDFGMTLSPPSITFSSGSSTSGTVSITSLSGLAGTISLSTSTPSGLAITCPSSVNLSSGGTSTASCSFSSSSHGTFQGKITGTFTCNNCYYNGNDIHSLSITVTVTPEFSISSNPTSQSLIACDSCYAQNDGYFTITLTSLGGFSGNVNVTANASPGVSNWPCIGLELDFVSSDYYGCGYSTTILSVPAGGTVTDGLQVFVHSNTAKGQYSITVKATSGTLVHLITVQVTVTSGRTLSNDPSSPDWTILSGTWTQKNGVIDATGSSPLTMSTANFGSDRIVTVRAITITAGSNVWNTAWIGGKYVDANNSIKLLLHTDGKLELQFKQNGVQWSYTTSSSTGLSPSAWHTFHMVFLGNDVKAYVDGTLYLDVTNSLVGTLGGAHISLESGGAPESQFDSMTISYSYTLSNNPGSSDWTVVSGAWTQRNQVIDGYGTYPRLKSTVSYAANRVVTVRMRTVISGPNLWNVAWVYAKYLDENNRIAAYLRPDGYIELDYTHSGSTQYYVSTQQTTLKITDWHTYTIVFSGNEIQVQVDGTVYIDATNTSFGTFGVAPVALATPWTSGNDEGQFDSVTIGLS